jgi:hypothetical protein
MNHEQLMLITATMPMKTIEVGGLPYLERYYIGTLPNGTQEWLHRFLRADSEPHLHSHPWDADSTILCGDYLEEVQRSNGHKFSILHGAGMQNIITTDKLHRIVDVEPNTWTHMRVYAGREPVWYFIDDATDTDVGTKTEMKTSPIDWWKYCKPRGY